MKQLPHLRLSPAGAERGGKEEAEEKVEEGAQCVSLWGIR